MLGLRDYVRKNGFPEVVLGLSGGIDSALTAAIAVDALGADNVHCADAAVALHRAKQPRGRQGLRQPGSAFATTRPHRPRR